MAIFDVKYLAGFIERLDKVIIFNHVHVVKSHQLGEILE